MKKLSGRILLAGALIFYCGLFIYTVVYADGIQHARKTITADPLYVRVLIDEKETDHAGLTKSIWSLSAQASFIISDLKNPDRCQTLDARNISIGIARDGRLVINGRRLLSDYIKIESTQGPIKLKNYTYNGDFFVIKQAAKLLLINCVELEEYVESGLRWEMVPGWPAATLEAGAIAYRTYVINTLWGKKSWQKTHKDGEETDTPTSFYDIGSTWLYQVYRGTHTCRSIRAAVEKTRGLVITSNKKPILALYHACCGGSIPSKRANVDFNQYAHLDRAYPCVYCKKFKCFSWKYSCSLGALSSKLHSLLPKKSSKKTSAKEDLITDIAIAKKDRAGAVQKISIKIGAQQLILPTSKMTALIKEIKSGTFTIVKRGKHVFFEGKGFGHQLGFCQWGACGLGQKGWSCSEILHFYYPKTVILNRKEMA